MLIAQITDMHVSTASSGMEALIDMSGHLERAVDHLNALRPRPDVLFATGDLVEHGRRDEYEHLREILGRLAMPVYVIPGNHDDRANLTAAFADHRYLPRDGGFLQYAIDDWPLRLVALDTLVPGETGGALDAGRLAWLDARLAGAPDRPTVVFMHHPPFVTGMPAMDGMGMRPGDAAALAAIVRRHPQVERIACGHVHRPIVRRFAGTVACTCPGTAHQVALDLAPERRLATVMEPPACLLHFWLDTADGVVTHVSPIGTPPVFTVFDGEKWLKDAVPPRGFNPRRSAAG